MGKGSSKLRKRSRKQQQQQQLQQQQLQRQRQRTSSVSSSHQAGGLASSYSRQLSRSCQDLQLQQQLQQQQQQQHQQQHQRQQSRETRPCQVRALFRFEAQVEGDLSICKNDILEVLDNNHDGLWVLARNVQTQHTGYVPFNYVQLMDGLPHSLDCWFNVDRREAERNLLLPGHPAGSYLLRPCHQAADQAQLTLSVRAESQGDSVRTVQVKHYLVKQDASSSFYINPKLTFSSVEQLLQHYQSKSDGLCCCLTSACPREWLPPAQLRDFEVNRQSLLKVKLLGQGSFGEVWQAKLNRLVDVAVKSMKPDTMNKEDFMDEAKLHYKLHHPRVVQLLGVCTAEEPIYIITEFMPNGSLTQYLKQDRERRRISFSDMTDMMYQVADGMEYLSNPENNVVHRDLRSANILVGVSNIVKVSDFGLSRCLHEENTENHIKFPVRWTAPEAAKTKNFTTKSDVWSFGVLMFEIVSRGELPYKELTSKEVIPRVSDGYRLGNPRDTEGAECSEYLYDVMLHCWATDPDERPTFESLRNIFENYGNDAPDDYGVVGRRASQFSLANASNHLHS